MSRRIGHHSLPHSMLEQRGLNEMQCAGHGALRKGAAQSAWWGKLLSGTGLGKVSGRRQPRQTQKGLATPPQAGQQPPSTYAAAKISRNTKFHPATPHSPSSLFPTLFFTLFSLTLLELHTFNFCLTTTTTFSSLPILLLFAVSSDIARLYGCPVPTVDSSNPPRQQLLLAVARPLACPTPHSPLSPITTTTSRLNPSPLSIYQAGTFTIRQF